MEALPKGPDSMPRDQRDLYESSRHRYFLSYSFLATAVLFVGFIAQAGGRSAWASAMGETAVVRNGGEDLQFAYESARDGFGEFSRIF